MSIKLRYLYRAYRYRYRVDRAELRFLCGILQRGQVAVDIGCHKGAYTYWMRRRVGSLGAVYAFEPQPRQVDYLRGAFAAMRYKNVELIPVAVSDQCGRLPLTVSHEAGATHAATLERPGGELAGAGAPTASPRGAGSSLFEVDVTTLGDFFARRPGAPHFIKIDVEGHELAVLHGARRLLETARPALLVECEARHRADGEVRPVLDLLQSLGYEGSFFLDGRRLPLAKFDPRRHQHVEPGAARLPRHYANNFAFVHGGS